MNPASEAKIQQNLAQTPDAQAHLRRLAFRRSVIILCLIGALGLFLLWLPAPSRRLLLASIIASRTLIGLLLLFGFVALSLVWTVGQRFDVWLFRVLNLNQFHGIWVDRGMWVATQLGSGRFAALLAGIAYVLGAPHYAIDLVFGSLTLWLLVTILKALTDRARPFNLLRDTRVIGIHEPGLSFPSGHTAQTFFTATLTINHFQLPLVIAVGLIGIGVMVGFTRVYLGAHYPRDVIAGATLGLIWGTLSVLIAPYLVL